VTTMNILDVSGAPWPIQDITWAGNFEIVQPEAGGHVVRITPMSEFAYGNMSVRLLELDTPITFVLRTHRDGVFYRVDLRLPVYGPNAIPPIIDGGITIAAGNLTMTAVLDGMPPQDAVKMQVTGADGRTTAYKFEDSTYVRTPLTLLSPAWKSSVKSADGTNVYLLGNAPVLLLSDQGRMIHARLAEKEQNDE
jgi:intracellular multiplication protein IcmK